MPTRTKGNPKPARPAKPRDMIQVRAVEALKALRAQAALFGCHQPVELVCDLHDLADAALLGREPQEVAHELVRVADEVREHGGLRGRMELRVAEDRAQPGRVTHGCREVGHLLVDDLEPAVLLRRLEERLRVPAVNRGYFAASSRTEKSRSRIDSSIRRRWSASSSTLPVTFVVAISVSSATSARIC